MNLTKPPHRLSPYPVVAGSFAGLQHREKKLTQLLSFPSSDPQVGHVLHLPELWQLTTEKATDFLKCTAALFKFVGTGRTLEKEGDYNRHLPLWLNVQ